MSTAARPTAAPMRFSNGDTIRLGDDTTWSRVLPAGQWSVRAGEDPARTDESMRELLACASDWRLFPAIPNVHSPLPGTACNAPDALRTLELRPATGALLYAGALNRLQSFLGNESGVLRSNFQPVPLTLREVRASLLGTLKRHPRASMTYQRTTGRLYVRYAVANSTIQTHIYVLTAS
ncbi:hypothetical protein [Streptomyces sp. NPDC058268]|uniref:hypothetical protein n=1 Tax=Streptomyces sp. NPDC058268 TaxID=3346413 RepID=UPI0036E57BA6